MAPASNSGKDKTIQSTVRIAEQPRAAEALNGSQTGPVGAQDKSQSPLSDLFFPNHVVDPRAYVNGCGSQGDDGVDVPDQIGAVSFTQACNWHDRCYGTKGLSQGYCDRGMYAKTFEACGVHDYCRDAAAVYYAGVTVFGGKPYREGQEAACERTPRRDGRVHGDPHLITPDGVSYTFMAAGEFALIRDAHGNDLVQSRFYPQGESFTVVSGVAVRLGDSEVVLQQDPETSEVTVLDDGLIDTGIAVPGTRQVVSVRGWDGLQVDAVVYTGRMDLSAHVPEPMWGAVSGLLGNADGDGANDLVDRHGRILTGWSVLSDVYEADFVDFYRVDPDESMFVPGGDFDYHADDIGKYPSEIPDLSIFSNATYDAARERCRAAGLDGELLESCVFDVLVSGDDSYADSSARSAARARDIAHPHDMDGSTPSDGVVLEAEPPLVTAIEADDIDEVRRFRCR